MSKADIKLKRVKSPLLRKNKAKNVEETERHRTQVRIVLNRVFRVLKNIKVKFSYKTFRISR